MIIKTLVMNFHSEKCVSEKFHKKKQNFCCIYYIRHKPTRFQLKDYFTLILKAITISQPWNICSTIVIGIDIGPKSASLPTSPESSSLLTTSSQVSPPPDLQARMSKFEKDLQTLRSRFSKIRTQHSKK